MSPPNEKYQQKKKQKLEKNETEKVWRWSDEWNFKTLHTFFSILILLSFVMNSLSLVSQSTLGIKKGSSNCKNRDENSLVLLGDKEKHAKCLRETIHI